MPSPKLSKEYAAAVDGAAKSAKLKAFQDSLAAIHERLE
jgi:hypothetical protein